MAKKTVEIDGIPYTIPENKSQQELELAIRTNVDGLGAEHDQKLRESGRRFYEEEASGAVDGFVHGLTNSPRAGHHWLGSRRFPEDLQSGRDPGERYYVDPDSDDVMFIDVDGVYGPKGRAYKEFGDVLEFGDIDKDDLIGWMGPGAQLLSEMILGGLGMAGGATFGTATPALGGPGAGTVVGGMVGGGLGSAGGTVVGQGIRSGLSAVVGGPESDFDQLVSDTAWSAGFGLIPVGLPRGALGQAFRQLGDAVLPKIGYLREQFPDEAGQDLIAAILKEGGGEVDSTIAKAAERGIKLTRGEAMKGIGQAAFAQYYLGLQSRSRLLTDMYLDRSQQVTNMVKGFADQLTSGKYVSNAFRDPLTGKVKGGSSSTVEIDVAKAADDFIKAEQKKRSEQAGEIYRQAYELDEAGSPELAALVDTFLTARQVPNTARDGEPLQGILVALRDPDLDPLRKEAYSTLRDALISKKRATSVTGKEGQLSAPSDYLPIDTSQDVAKVLQETFDTLITKYGKSDTTRNKKLVGELSNLKASMNDAFRSYNPVWGRAQDIYRPEDPMSTLQNFKIIADIAKVAESGGTEAARAVSRIFSGSAEPVDILKLKTAVMEQNPAAWQRLKGNWLRTKFNDVSQRTSNELGVPNKFLGALSLRGDVADLTKASDKGGFSSEVATYRALFEPEELKELAEISDILQMVRSVQDKINSDTQTKQKFAELLSIESNKAGVSAPEIIFNMFGLLGRSAKSIRDSVNGSMAAKYKQERINAYEDVLIEQVINPDPNRTLLKQMKESFPRYYAIATQALKETGQAMEEGVTPSPETQIREKRASSREEEQERLREEAASQIKMMESSQASPPSVTDIFAPLPSMGGGMSSLGIPGATVLPSEQDRELAERLRQSRSGIGGLAV
jgi:hypothetical protein